MAGCPPLMDGHLQADQEGFAVQKSQQFRQELGNKQPHSTAIGKTVKENPAKII